MKKNKHKIKIPRLKYGEFLFCIKYVLAKLCNYDRDRGDISLKKYRNLLEAVRHAGVRLLAQQQG